MVFPLQWMGQVAFWHKYWHFNMAENRERKVARVPKTGWLCKLPKTSLSFKHILNAVIAHIGERSYYFNSRLH